MIVPKKNTGTAENPIYEADIPGGAEVISYRYRGETDDYEVETKTVSAEKWRVEIILEEMGLLDTVNQIVSQADNRVQKAWEKASSLNRHSKAIEGIRLTLKLSHEQVDDIFNRANAIDI